MVTTSRARVPKARAIRGTVAKKAARLTPPSVNRLVEAATGMFNQFGIHATGIDRILAEAGVARMTLYNHFGSKEGLVREVLERESLAWFQRLDCALDQAGPSARDKVSVYFDVLQAWFSQPDFKGCGFMNAVGESARDDACVRPIAKAHRDANVAYVRKLLGEEGLNADALADTIIMIADGATVDVMVTGDLVIVERARRVALYLLDNAG